MLVSLKQFFSGANRLKKVTCVKASLDCVQFVIPGAKFWLQCVCVGGGGAIFTWGYLKKNLYKCSFKNQLPRKAAFVKAFSCCVDSSSFQK